MTRHVEQLSRLTLLQLQLRLLLHLPLRLLPHLFPEYAALLDVRHVTRIPIRIRIGVPAHVNTETSTQVARIVLVGLIVVGIRHHPLMVNARHQRRTTVLITQSSGAMVETVRKPCARMGWLRLTGLLVLFASTLTTRHATDRKSVV